jgi:hypothetical protein
MSRRMAVPNVAAGKRSVPLYNTTAPTPFMHMSTVATMENLSR